MTPRVLTTSALHQLREQWRPMTLYAATLTVSAVAWQHDLVLAACLLAWLSLAPAAAVILPEQEARR